MCVQWCPGMTKFQSVCARLSWIWPVCEWEGAEKKQGERGRKNEVSRLVGGRDEGGDTWGWGGGPGRDGPRITRLWPSTGNLHTITHTPTYMWAHTCASNVDVSQGKDGKSSVCVCVCVCLSVCKSGESRHTDVHACAVCGFVRSLAHSLQSTSWNRTFCSQMGTFASWQQRWSVYQRKMDRFGRWCN